MSLSPGTKLGAFEVSGLLGVGGMGEVYQARDSKLGRNVAIKVLPEVFSRDSERLARFKREARLLASLDHSNICAVHDLQEAEGTQFMVMPLLDGETLSARIGRGPIPIAEALALFARIVEALEAAHEQGIIHRDLKPGNIMVTDDGKVEVLDFGLGKAIEPREPASSDASTRVAEPDSAKMSQEGVVLGTPVYMSPEQARGKPVDKRTDIWAFGCCLYEALTGGIPFGGETISDTIAAVLEHEPDWVKLPEGLPPEVPSLLRRCLTKERPRRLSGAGDIAITLGDATEAALAAIPRPRPKAPKHAGEKIVRRYHYNLPPSLPYDSGLTVSPDGRWIAYVTNIDGVRHLVLRQVDQLDARIITRTDGARRPFFSPDSKWVGFFSQTNMSLNKISVYGGTPMALCRNITFPLGASWGEDDHIVFTMEVGGGLHRIVATGGSPEELTTLDRSAGEIFHTVPEYLPGAKVLLYTAATGTEVANSRVVALNRETGERKTVAEGAARPHFAPTGHVTFMQLGSVSVAPFDVDRLEVTGPIVPVTETRLMDAESNLTHYAFSKDGLLVYAPMGGGSSAQLSRALVWVDREGAEEEIPLPPGQHRIPRVSPDGKRVAVSDGSIVWSYDLERATKSRLTFGQHSENCPLWSPDGSRIVVSSNRDGPNNLYWRAVDGRGKEERLTESDSFHAAFSWSRDGTLLAYTEYNAETGRHIGLLSLEGERSSRLVLEMRFDEGNPSISPDGRWLAYDCDESGRYEIYVQSLPDMGGKWQVTNEGGFEPLWSPDGRELFYRVENRMIAVSIETDPTIVPGNPNLVFERQYYVETTGSRSYDISTDGQRFLMIKEVDSADDRRNRTELIVVENWFEELKRLAPVD